MKDWPISEIQDIWQLVSRLHDGQKYGGPNDNEQIEYLNHIGSVVFEIIAAAHQNESLNAGLAIKCAMLHDTIEDTEITYKYLKSRYGQAVADGVQALTKNEAIEGKKAQMIDSLNRIKQQPKEIWAVKMADRICNLYAPPYYWTNEKKQAYQQEAILILESLKEGDEYLAERLRLKIESYNKFINE